MTLSKNPTRTLTIEKSWKREINRRWREYKKTTLGMLERINNQAIQANAVKGFDLDASQIRIYMTFLDAQISQLLLGSQQAPNWQAKYQSQSYQRALEATRAQLISQGASIVRTQEEIAAGLGLQPLSATPSIATGATLTQPIHQDALQFLFTRSYDSLKGWTDKLSTETRQILVNGIEQGQGIREITKNITDRIDVSKSRAQLIARTETIQAYQRGATNETKRLEEELDEEIKMRWVTALDSRVRHLHAAWHGTLVTPEENFARIERSPWNCRCTQIATIEEANTPAKQAKFDKERKELLKKEKARPVVKKPVAKKPLATPKKAPVKSKSSFGNTTAAKWQERGFSNSRQNAQDIAKKHTDISVTTKRGGSWAQSGKLINMTVADEASKLSANTWRHEFGHILDYRVGAKNRKFMISSDFDFSGALNRDGEQLKMVAGKGRKKKLIKTLADEKENAYASALKSLTDTTKAGRVKFNKDMAKTNGLDYKKLTNFLDETTGAADYSTLEESVRLANVMESIRLKDAERFYNKATRRGEANHRAIVNSDGIFRSFSDMVGAGTKNGVCSFNRGYPGHSDGYYKRRGTGQAEAFANLMAGYGHPNKYTFEIFERFVPDASKTFVRLINE